MAALQRIVLSFVTGGGRGQVGRGAGWMGEIFCCTDCKSGRITVIFFVVFFFIFVRISARGAREVIHTATNIKRGDIPDSY